MQILQFSQIHWQALGCVFLVAHCNIIGGLWGTIELQEDWVTEKKYIKESVWETSHFWLHTLLPVSFLSLFLSTASHFFYFFSSKNCCENKEGGSGGGGSWCLLLSPSVYGSVYINMLPELEHWNRRYKWYCQVEVAVIVFQCSQISISYAIVKVNQF